MKNKMNKNIYSKRARLYDFIFMKILRGESQYQKFFVNSGLLEGDAIVLDAGCGTGALTMAYLSAGKILGKEPKHIYAFDFTKEMLNLFNRRIQNQEVSSVKIIQADVTESKSMPSTWKDYDLVMSAAMFEHLNDGQRRQAITNLADLIKPGGKLILFVTRRNWLTAWLVGRWWQARLFDQEQVDRLLSSAGLTSISTAKIWAGSMFVAVASKKRH
jgi:ubiquinone/menaquinone biosynthesis C-methylase UbiE